MSKKLKPMTPSEMGRKGGSISRRTLTTEQARAMVHAREKKKAMKAKNEDPVND